MRSSTAVLIALASIAATLVLAPPPPTNDFAAGDNIKNTTEEYEKNRVKRFYLELGEREHHSTQRKVEEGVREHLDKIEVSRNR